MSSLAELPELVGFFSYSRDDDEAFKGTLSAPRAAIERDLSAQIGRSRKTFRLWQDQAAISPGELWEKEIKEAVDESFFFIPIVTPRSINSKYCKFEFELFLAREKALGRNNLVFPILYISVAALEDEAKWRRDSILAAIGQRQYVDWRPLRYLDVETSKVREQIGRFCQKIVESLNEPWTSPEERRRMEEDKRKAEEEQRQKKHAEAQAREQAEEEQKAQRLEAEAKRRADEEEARKRVEAEARERAKAEREAKETEEARQRAEAQAATQLATEKRLTAEQTAKAEEARRTETGKLRLQEGAEPLGRRLREAQRDFVLPIIHFILLIVTGLFGSAMIVGSVMVGIKENPGEGILFLVLGIVCFAASFGFGGF